MRLWLTGRGRAGGSGETKASQVALYPISSFDHTMLSLL